MGLFANEQNWISLAFFPVLMQFVLKQQSADCSCQGTCDLVGKPRNVHNLDWLTIWRISAGEMRQYFCKGRSVGRIVFRQEFKPGI